MTKVKVRAGDIKTGIKNAAKYDLQQHALAPDDRSECYPCMVELALRRLVKDDVRIEVEFCSVSLERLNRAGLSLQHHDLPSSVSQKVRRHDAIAAGQKRTPIKPFEFELDIPTEFLK